MTTVEWRREKVVDVKMLKVEYKLQTTHSAMHGVQPQKIQIIHCVVIG